MEPLDTDMEGMVGEPRQAKPGSRLNAGRVRKPRRRTALLVDAGLHVDVALLDVERVAPFEQQPTGPGR